MPVGADPTPPTPPPPEKIAALPSGNPRFAAAIAAADAAEAGGAPNGALVALGEADGGTADAGAPEPGVAAAGPADAAVLVDASGAADPATAAQGDPAAPLTAAQERSEYIAQHKARRSAQEAEKRARKAAAEARSAQQAAQTSLAQAEAWERSKAEWARDPTAMSRAAGIDPTEHFKALVHHHATDGAPPPPDPVAERVDASLRPYVEQIEAQRREIEQQRQQNAVAQTVVQQVLPILNTPAAAERYESLFTVTGGPAQAAGYVFNEVQKHYQATGEIIPFESAAEQLEAHHEEAIRRGIEQARRLKKFGTAFAPSVTAPAAAPKPAVAAVAAVSRPAATTLTNKQNAPAAARAPAIGSSGGVRHPTGNDRLDRVKAKLGIA